ncbi:MAG: hypothetical protein LBU87_02045 [Lactobacillales bacterium]|nr:hypothetical protein [Lactobacillales bacterium]
MTQKVKKMLKTTMAAGASFAAILADSMAESRRGTIDIELENGSKVTFLEFNYSDKASSESETYKNSIEQDGKWIPIWQKMQDTEYQLPNGIILSDSTWIKSYDKKHEKIFHTSRTIRIAESTMHVKNGRVINLDTYPKGNNGGACISVESNIKWPYTMVSLYDFDFSNYYSILDVKYDLNNKLAMNASSYSEWYIDPETKRLNKTQDGFYANRAPSKTTKQLEEFVPLVDGLLEKMYPKKNRRIMSIPGLTMDKDVLWKLADVDVSHVQRRDGNETAKTQTPKRTDAMLAASQGKAPAYMASATVSDQVVSDMKKHARKTEDSINEANKKRLEELMREIQAEGGTVGTASKPERVSQQPIVAKADTGRGSKVKL